MGPRGPNWKEAINQFAILAVDESGKHSMKSKSSRGNDCECVNQLF